MPNIPDGYSNPVTNNPNGFNQNSGQSLPESLRHQMETAFGADLSNVKVHESHAATHLKATSFTQGSDIYFAPGQYQPHSEQGQQLLAHELAHVAQQNGGVNSKTIGETLEDAAQSVSDWVSNL